jgi:hypothetical protein
MLKLCDARKKQTPEEMGQELLSELNKGFWECDAKRALLLIAEGASLDEKIPGGRTALHLSVYYSITDCLEALIAAGAKLDEKDNNGDTALALGEKLGSMEGKADCIRMLKEAMAQRAAAEARAAEEKRKKFLDDTDCGKGLAHQIPAAKPLRSRPPGM